jgi:hypothetical protein
LAVVVGYYPQSKVDAGDELHCGSKVDKAKFRVNGAAFFYYSNCLFSRSYMKVTFIHITFGLMCGVHTHLLFEDQRHLESWVGGIIANAVASISLLCIMKNRTAVFELSVVPFMNLDGAMMTLSRVSGELGAPKKVSVGIRIC